MEEDLISAHELQKCLKSGAKMKLIDVRTQQEHEAFNIGGELIPLQELQEHISLLDKSDDIVIYCHTGARSMLATKLLKQLEFSSVRPLSGGVVAWQAEELSPA